MTRLAKSLTKKRLRTAKALRRYRGQWVTMSQDESRVLGYGKTATLALKMARNRGEGSPFLTKVPQRRSATTLFF